MAASRPVRSASRVAGPALVPLGHHTGRPPIPLLRPVVVIGSRSNSRIHLVSSSVSKAHALVVRSNGRTYIRDLASRTKVIINDEPVREAELHDGDVLKIGSFSFAYKAGPEEAEASVRKSAIPAKLDVAESDFPVPIDERVVLIGRRSTCDLPLLEESVSTAHAVIFEMNGERFIRDLGSRTGTFVNGVSTHQHQLTPGDRIRIGETEIRYIPNEVAAAVVIDEEPATGDADDLAALALADAEDSGAVAIEPDEPRIAVPAEPAARQEPLELDLADLAADESADEAPVEPPPQVEDKTAEPIAVEADEAEAEADPEEIAVAPQEQAEPLASADIADEAPALSEAQPETSESLSVEEVEADKHDEKAADEIAPGDLATAEQVEQTELPRRGWHGALAAEVEQTEPAEESAEPVASEEDVLKFPDSISSSDQTSDPIELGVGDSATAVLDQDSLQADLVEEPVESAASEDEAGSELGLETENLVDLIAPPPVAPPIEKHKPLELSLDLHDEPAAEPTPIELDEAPVFTPEPESNKPLTPLLDLAPAVDVEPLADEPVDEIHPAEDSPRPLIASVEIATSKPAPKSIIEAEIKLHDDEPPRDEHADAVEVPVSDEKTEPEPRTDAVAEIVEPTRPTAESALEESEQELLLAAPTSAEGAPAPAVDDLSDTTFDQAVREFAGDKLGDIVEPAPREQAEDVALAALEGSEPVEIESPIIAESIEESSIEVPHVELPAPNAAVVEAPADELELDVPEPAIEAPVEEKLHLQDETPAVEAPKFEPPAAAQVPWGANQDNFLGGAPLDLRTPPKLSETPIGDEAVKDLIEEIDSAAAAAEAAATAPADASEEQLAPVILPPRPRRGNVFRASRRRDQELTEPQADAPKEKELTTGFDALAMPGVREMDVFSQMSPPAVEESAPRAAKDTEPQAEEHPAPPPRRSRAVKHDAPPRLSIEEEMDDPDSAARRQRVVPAIPVSVEGSVVAERRPPVAFAAERTEAEAAAVRRKYFRRAAVLLGLMVLSIAGAALVIFKYVGVSTTVEGTLTYTNLGALTEHERLAFHRRQKQYLQNDTTRRMARATLNSRMPNVSPAYLNDQQDYLKVAERAGFSSQRPDALTIRVYGSDATSEKARVLAMLDALYNAGAGDIEQARENRNNLEQLNRAIAESQQQIDALNREIEKLRILGESRPSPEEIASLESDVANLEKKWNAAVIAAKTAEAELARIKSAPASNAGATAAAVPVEDDQQIKTMQAELDKLQAKVAETRSANAESAAAARKQLDETLDAFQKRVSDAQGMMNGNPEIAAFIQSAQKLQETTRQLTDDLIRRQEQQFSRLMELKERLNDKMEQRRIELWQNDKQLQELEQQLAVLTRRYNAALGGGLQKESDDLKVEIDLAKNMIKARQELLPGDTFYADAIKQLGVIIESTQKNIEDDRRKTEALLTTLQQGFTSGETLKQLPAEQQQLAEGLQKQLEAINAARQQYNQAVDAGAADADAQLKQQIATIQAGIEARRHQLVEQNIQNLRSQQEQSRLGTIEAKQAELDQMNLAEAEARKAYFDKHKQLRDAQALLADAKANAERLDQAIRQKEVAQRSLESALANVENKKREVNRAVEPVKPTDNDIIARTGEDMRLMYTLASGGAILLLFTGLILWTLHIASVEAPPLSLHAAAFAPIAEEQASNKLLSNGQDKPDPKPAPGSEEDHEPAVI